MKSNIIRIGNSQGVRIPKAVLEQCGLQGRVNMDVEDNRLIIAAAQTLREGWAKSFQSMADKGDDAMLMDENHTSEWDEQEWQW